MEKRKRIGIMGGTFDPIHIGHLILGETAYQQFQLDKVLFMPAGNPPHKSCLLYTSCAFCQPEAEKLDLCGISLGGILALHYAISHPERVNSLVLIGTQYVMPRKLLAIQNFMFRLMSEQKFEGIGFSKKDFIQLSRTMAKLDFHSELTNIILSLIHIFFYQIPVNDKLFIKPVTL